MRGSTDDHSALSSTTGADTVLDLLFHLSRNSSNSTVCMDTPKLHFLKSEGVAAEDNCEIRSGQLQYSADVGHSMSAPCTSVSQSAETKLFDVGKIGSDTNMDNASPFEETETDVSIKLTDALTKIPQEKSQACDAGDSEDEEIPVFKCLDDDSLLSDFLFDDKNSCEQKDEFKKEPWIISESLAYSLDENKRKFQVSEIMNDKKRSPYKNKTDKNPLELTDLRSKSMYKRRKVSGSCFSRETNALSGDFKQQNVTKTDTPAPNPILEQADWRNDTSREGKRHGKLESRQSHTFYPKKKFYHKMYRHQVHDKLSQIEILKSLEPRAQSCCDLRQETSSTFTNQSPLTRSTSVTFCCPGMSNLPHNRHLVNLMKGRLSVARKPGQKRLYYVLRDPDSRSEYLLRWGQFMKTHSRVTRGLYCGPGSRRRKYLKCLQKFGKNHLNPPGYLHGKLWYAINAKNIELLPTNKIFYSRRGETLGDARDRQRLMRHVIQYTDVLQPYPELAWPSRSLLAGRGMSTARVSLSESRSTRSEQPTERSPFYPKREAGLGMRCSARYFLTRRHYSMLEVLKDLALNDGSAKMTRLDSSTRVLVSCIGREIFECSRNRSSRDEPDSDKGEGRRSLSRERRERQRQRKSRHRLKHDARSSEYDSRSPLSSGNEYSEETSFEWEDPPNVKTYTVSRSLIYGDHPDLEQPSHSEVSTLEDTKAFVLEPSVYKMPGIINMSSTTVRSLYENLPAHVVATCCDCDPRMDMAKRRIEREKKERDKEIASNKVFNDPHLYFPQKVNERGQKQLATFDSSYPHNVRQSSPEIKSDANDPTVRNAVTLRQSPLSKNDTFRSPSPGVRAKDLAPPRTTATNLVPVSIQKKIQSGREYFYRAETVTDRPSSSSPTAPVVIGDIELEVLPREGMQYSHTGNKNTQKPLCPLSSSSPPKSSIQPVRGKFNLLNPRVASRLTKQHTLDILDEFCSVVRPLSPMSEEKLDNDTSPGVVPDNDNVEETSYFLPASHSDNKTLHCNNGRVDLVASSGIVQHMKRVGACSVSVPCAGAIQYEVCGMTVVQLFGTPHYLKVEATSDKVLKKEVVVKQDDCCRQDPSHKDQLKHAVTPTGHCEQMSLGLLESGKQHTLPNSQTEINCANSQSVDLLNGITASDRKLPNECGTACKNIERFQEAKITKQLCQDVTLQDEVFQEVQIGGDNVNVVAEETVEESVSLDATSFFSDKRNVVMTEARNSFTDLYPESPLDDSLPYLYEHLPSLEFIDTDINNNQGDTPREEKYATDPCLSPGSERQTAHTYGDPIRTGSCEQDYLCDDMNTPIVLSASDRVYHVSGTPNDRHSPVCAVQDRFGLGHDFLTELDFTLSELEGLASDTVSANHERNVCDYSSRVDLPEDPLASLQTSRQAESQDTLTRAMHTAGLTDSTIDSFLRSDFTLESFLMDQGQFDIKAAANREHNGQSSGPTAPAASNEADELLDSILNSLSTEPELHIPSAASGVGWDERLSPHIHLDIHPGTSANTVARTFNLKDSSGVFTASEKTQLVLESPLELPELQNVEYNMNHCIESTSYVKLSSMEVSCVSSQLVSNVEEVPGCSTQLDYLMDVNILNPQPQIAHQVNGDRPLKDLTSIQTFCADCLPQSHNHADHFLWPPFTEPTNLGEPLTCTNLTQLAPSVPVELSGTVAKQNNLSSMDSQELSEILNLRPLPDNILGDEEVEEEDEAEDNVNTGVNKTVGDKPGEMYGMECRQASVVSREHQMFSTPPERQLPPHLQRRRELIRACLEREVKPYVLRSVPPRPVSSVPTAPEPTPVVQEIEKKVQCEVFRARRIVLLDERKALKTQRTDAETGAQSQDIKQESTSSTEDDNDHNERMPVKNGIVRRRTTRQTVSKDKDRCDTKAVSKSKRRKTTRLSSNNATSDASSSTTERVLRKPKRVRIVPSPQSNSPPSSPVTPKVSRRRKRLEQRSTSPINDAQGVDNSHTHSQMETSAADVFAQQLQSVSPGFLSKVSRQSANLLEQSSKVNKIATKVRRPLKASRRRLVAQESRVVIQESGKHSDAIPDTMNDRNNSNTDHISCQDAKGTSHFYFWYPKGKTLYKVCFAHIIFQEEDSNAQQAESRADTTPKADVSRYDFRGSHLIQYKIQNLLYVRKSGGSYIKKPNAKQDIDINNATNRDISSHNAVKYIYAHTGYYHHTKYHIRAAGRIMLYNRGNDYIKIYVILIGMCMEHVSHTVNDQAKNKRHDFQKKVDKLDCCTNANHFVDYSAEENIDKDKAGHKHSSHEEKTIADRFSDLNVNNSCSYSDSDQSFTHEEDDLLDFNNSSHNDGDDNCSSNNTSYGDNCGDSGNDNNNRVEDDAVDQVQRQNTPGSYRASQVKTPETLVGCLPPSRSELWRQETMITRELPRIGKNMENFNEARRKLKEVNSRLTKRQNSLLSKSGPAALTGYSRVGSFAGGAKPSGALGFAPAHQRTAYGSSLATYMVGNRTNGKSRDLQGEEFKGLRTPSVPRPGDYDIRAQKQKALATVIDRTSSLKKPKSAFRPIGSPTKIPKPSINILNSSLATPNSRQRCKMSPPREIKGWEHEQVSASNRSNAERVNVSPPKRPKARQGRVSASSEIGPDMSGMDTGLARFVQRLQSGYGEQLSKGNAQSQARLDQLCSRYMETLKARQLLQEKLAGGAVGEYAKGSVKSALQSHVDAVRSARSSKNKCSGMSERASENGFQQRSEDLNGLGNERPTKNNICSRTQDTNENMRRSVLGMGSRETDKRKSEFSLMPKTGENRAAGEKNTSSVKGSISMSSRKGELSSRRPTLSASTAQNKSVTASNSSASSKRSPRVKSAGELRPELKDSVDRLSSRPDSPLARLQHEISVWESRFGKSFKLGSDASVSQRRPIVKAASSTSSVPTPACAMTSTLSSTARLPRFQRLGVSRSAEESSIDRRARPGLRAQPEARQTGPSSDGDTFDSRQKKIDTFFGSLLDLIDKKESQMNKGSASSSHSKLPGKARPNHAPAKTGSRTGSSDVGATYRRMIGNVKAKRSSFMVDLDENLEIPPLSEFRDFMVSPETLLGLPQPDAMARSMPSIIKRKAKAAKEECLKNTLSNNEINTGALRSDLVSPEAIESLHKLEHTSYGSDLKTRQATLPKKISSFSDQEAGKPNTMQDKDDDNRSNLNSTKDTEKADTSIFATTQPLMRTFKKQSDSPVETSSKTAMTPTREITVLPTALPVGFGPEFLDDTDAAVSNLGDGDILNHDARKSNIQCNKSAQETRLGESSKLGSSNLGMGKSTKVDEEGTQAVTEERKFTGANYHHVSINTATSAYLNGYTQNEKKPVSRVTLMEQSPIRAGTMDSTAGEPTIQARVSSHDGHLSEAYRDTDDTTELLVPETGLGRLDNSIHYSSPHNFSAGENISLGRALRNYSRDGLSEDGELSLDSYRLRGTSDTTGRLQHSRLDDDILSNREWQVSGAEDRYLHGDTSSPQTRQYDIESLDALEQMAEQDFGAIYTKTVRLDKTQEMERSTSRPMWGQDDLDNDLSSGKRYTSCGVGNGPTSRDVAGGIAGERVESQQDWRQNYTSGYHSPNYTHPSEQYSTHTSSSVDPRAYYDSFMATHNSLGDDSTWGSSDSDYQTPDIRWDQLQASSPYNQANLSYSQGYNQDSLMRRGLGCTYLTPIQEESEED